MPDWKGHLISSLSLVIFWISILHFVNFQLTFDSIASIIALSVFTSLFPDIDMRGSKIRNTLSFVTAAVAIAAYIFFFKETWYYAPVYFVLLYLILKYLPTKHRGVTHTFGFSIIFSAVLACAYFVLSPFVPKLLSELAFWAAVVFSSYSLHLALDRI